MSRRLGRWLWLPWFGALLLPAQQPLEPLAMLAADLLPALAPERDDPDAQVRALLAAALAAPLEPAASLLAGEARARLTDVGDPAALRSWLAERRPATPCHGLLAQRLAEIDYGLWRRAGGTEPPDPLLAYAREAVVVGPFGDAGSHWLDVPLPPDDGFPALGTSQTGRFGPVAPRIVRRRAGQHALPLLQQRANARGAHYVRWRVRAAAPTAGFLEVEYRGSVLARVDGVEVGRADPYTAPQMIVQRFPVRLAAGEHEIVLKTGDLTEQPLALRLLDGNGAPLAVDEVAAAAPAAGADQRADPRADPRDRGRFLDGLTQLEQAAGSRTDDTGVLLEIAAAWAAQRTGEADRALQHALALADKLPPTPAAQLVLADVLLRIVDLPDEQRTARARSLADAAIQALPAGHHHAVLARVRQLEDQDQREAALRLLRGEVEAARAGPATFAAMHALLRRLGFTAELPGLLATWAERCPTDGRVAALLADRALQLGDARGALAHAKRAFGLRPGDEQIRAQLLRLLLDLEEWPTVRAVLDRVQPPEQQPPALERLTTLAALAGRQGDQTAQRQALALVGEHPDADAGTWRRLGERWLQLGDDARALAACERSLELDPDQPPVRELRARLGGAPGPGDAFAPLRRDGDAAIAAFVPGEQERSASTSLLIDQRLVEVLPDGSTLTEVHELRRVNDLQGVELLREGSDAARADELLLVRTVAADGSVYIPARVQDNFAMPRLEPGAFVEWRYRQRRPAAGAEPWQLEPFLFASHQEPLYLTEYVLILPAGARGGLRTRDLDSPATTQTLADGRRLYCIRRERVPRLPEEDSTPPAGELLPLAAYGEDASPWPSLRQTRASLLVRTRPTAPIAAFAGRLLEGSTDDQERLRRIADFCAREIEDGPTGNATEALLRKKGSRFLLTVALLRAAGVPFATAACRERRKDADGEPVFQPAEPAGVPAVRVQPAGQAPVWLFADVPRWWPTGAIPGQRGAARAFLIGEGAIEQVRLPPAEHAEQHVQCTGEAVVEQDRLVLRGRLQLGDLAGFGLADQLRRRTADVQALAARQVCQQLFPGYRVRQANPADLEPPGRPLALEFELQDAGAQAVADDRWLLPLPLPDSRLRESFGDRDERTLPLRLDHDLELQFAVAIDPGPGRRFAALPAPLLLSFGPLDYQLTFSQQRGTVRIERRLRLQPATLPVALYGQWLATLAAIDRAEQQQLVLLRSAEQGR